MPPDASRLIEYAESRKMDWMWRYRKNGDQWEAQAQITHGGDRAIHPGRGDNPQAAVDAAIERAISAKEAVRYAHRSHSNVLPGEKKHGR